MDAYNQWIPADPIRSHSPSTLKLYDDAPFSRGMARTRKSTSTFQSKKRPGTRVGHLKEKQLVRIGVLGAAPISQAAHFDACRLRRGMRALCHL